MRWYSKEPLEPIPVPVLGPDLMDPRQYGLIKKYAREKQEQEQAAAQEAAAQEAAGAANEAAGPAAQPST